MNNTYYDIFQISISASQQEIQTAYRKLAMEYHPDRNQDKELGEIKMKEINFIYSILSNAEKRKWYNSTISTHEEYQEEDKYSYSYSLIFCEELEVIDSTGRRTKLRVGDNIFYLVDIDKSIITWKYKSKEYFNLIVKNVFDPKQKELFAKTVKFDFNKTPLCTAHWANSEMIIYKEDFEAYWISQQSYAKIDKRKGITTGIIILVLFCLGAYYFYSEFSLSSERSDYLKKKELENSQILNDNKKYYAEEYFATESEVSYILSDFYTTCTKEITKTKKDVDVLNVPDNLGIVKGEIPGGKNVLVLLYCPKENGYKVKYNDLLGWVPGSSLENPKCKDDSTEDQQK